MSKNRNIRNWVIYGVLLLVLVGVLSSQLFGGIFNREPVLELSTSEFSTRLKNDQIVEVNYSIATATLSGRFIESEDDPASKAIAFTSTWSGDDSFNTLMNRYGSNERLEKWKIDPSNPNSWMSLIPSILLFVLFGALIWFMFTQFNNANNKQMQFGKTKAKKAHEERPTTKFDDVAGIDEAVEELQEIKDFLTNPKRYVELGAKIPRGVLLVGPPGTGKTLLARAVAGEAGVPFFSISGSDFVEMFVGVGASRVRDLFEQAKQAAPAIIFIDEIDAVGRQRGAGLGGGHDEREQTLNQLLVEMDGFDGHQSVILIAATNRMDILDPALLRPGRFDRQIVVMRPDLKGREQILKVHAEGKPLAHSVELEKLARMTPGFTGADLANLMNEAALLTARKGKKLITMSELDEAMEREIAGPERKSRIMTEKEKRIIAFHEAGHAMVGHVLENADPVHKISIISRGQALGYTLSLPSEDRFLSSRNEMYDELAMFLGGRVSEEIFCDDITTGASNDLERATKMARQMVTRYGMTEALGSQVYGEANHEVFLGRDYAATPDYSEATAQRIDEEVARIMGKAHDVAHSTLDSRREQMELIASVLMERETVEGKALEALLDNKWDDYLEHEDEYLAQKAEAERKQIEEDERHAAEERAKQLAMMPPPQGQPVAGAGSPLPGGLSTSEQPVPPQRPTLEDIFSGRVDLDELVQRRSGGSPGQAVQDGQDLPSAGAQDLPPVDAPASQPVDGRGAAQSPDIKAPLEPGQPEPGQEPEMSEPKPEPGQEPLGSEPEPEKPEKKPRKPRAKKGDAGPGDGE